MRILFLTLAFSVGVPAMAQCPQNAVQDAVNIWSGASQGTGGADAETRIDALSTACADNAYVLKIAALAHGMMSQRATAPEKILAHGIRARTLAMAMRDVQPPNETSVVVQVGGVWMPLQLYGDRFDRDVLLVYFSAQQRAKMLAPESKPVEPSETLRACRAWDSVEAQEVAAIIRENPKSDLSAPLGLLDRLVAICAANIAANRDAELLAYRARAVYPLLVDNPQRSGGRAMMDKLLADSKRFFELRPNGDGVYWSTYDRDRLAAFEIEFDVATGNAPPRTEWFKPKNTENVRVVRSIALALDDAWALDEPKGVTGKYQTYRELLGQLYTEATSSGDAVAARAAIAAAAKGQSDGSMRRAANKARKAPPDWLWSWVGPAPKPQ